MDNIFTERLWRTVKYENIYLKSYSTIKEAHSELTEYFEFYDKKRRHTTVHNGPFKPDPKEVMDVEFFSAKTIQNMLDNGVKFHPEFLFLWNKSSALFLIS